MQLTTLFNPVSLLNDPELSNQGSLYFNSASNVYRYFSSGSWVSMIDTKQHVTNIVSNIFYVGNPSTPFVFHLLTDEQMVGGTIMAYAGTALLLSIPDQSSSNVHIGSSFKIVRAGIGSVGVNGDENVTILAPSDVYLTSQYSSVNLLKVDEDLWVMSGEFPDIY